ncbi:MAG: DNA cytosine methyltransferase [Lachnospiraceae bacterium]|nr:DNA cytosine methyltransferase [Lachnospiraceae bacterium]
MKKLRCASFFAGVGGIDLGFHNAGFETVYANEIDKFAVRTYEENFNIKVDCRDINDVKTEQIPDFDIMLAGFPCQAFSLAGLRQGFDDEKGRGILFFQLERIFIEKKPKIIFLENVKNLVGHDNGNTFRVILESLHKQGYKAKYQVMNAMDYGNIAQNRERIYIVAFKEEELYKKFCFPDPIQRTSTVKDIIDFETKMDDKYYYTEGKYKGDIFEQLDVAMKEDDIDNPSIYQWRRKYVRKNQSGVVPTLTANQGEGGHNVCLVKTKFGIRKMLPKECFNAQGYPKAYKLPDELSDAKLYKQAGNSVVVPVIERIARSIADII